ncbi:hypothetical protein P3T76_011281 [Phytophthora citrophthora]|uniref:DUF6818 domain-containing protein n=1 Tax=Phytophthora citrophthora TaxID=4793 RepID=A0AAD9LGF1_9STRA|nr:hypothetical protein P3T76_011281 [Phytophthora citrophthora]
MARSSKFGTVNYSADEMRRLNANVRAVLPLVGEDWLRVAYYFNYQRPEAIPFRDVESLKRKFKKMYCSRGKSLPDYIVEAKELRENIQQSTKQITGTEEQEKELEENELTLKLRQMEEEYQKILEGKRGDMEVKTMTDEQSGATSTAEVIALLMQSVERKRHAVEEQVMDENARVRRERKKQKVEKVLSSIHQDQGEQETEEQSEVLSSRRSDQQKQEESSFNAASPALPPMTQPEDAPSLRILELILQALNAQQIESSRQFEVEQARQEQEKREREERWRQTELRRSREHRQLMLAMSALLGDRFPESLNRHLNEEDPTN